MNETEAKLAILDDKLIELRKNDYLAFLKEYQQRAINIYTKKERNINQKSDDNR